MTELAGLKETLRSTDSEFAEWHQTAVKCFEESLALFNSDEYRTKKGWKKEQEDAETEDTVYSLPTKNGKLFCIRIELGIDQELFFNDLVQSIDTEYQHNPNFEFSKRVTWLGEQSDIVHVVMKEQWLVKSRDMVSARIWRKLGDSFVIASRSVDCELVFPQKNKIRADMKFGTGRFSPCPNKAGHCIMEFLTQVDFKGWMPKSLLDAFMGKLLLSDAVIQRKRVERILDAKREK